MASYLKALVYLRQGDVERARPEVEVLRQELQHRKHDKKLELNLWETQGLLLCRTGAGDAGVKLLERAVQKTKDDYSHHSWGNGAYYMEAWGIGARRRASWTSPRRRFWRRWPTTPAACGRQWACR